MGSSLPLAAPVAAAGHVLDEDDTSSRGLESGSTRCIRGSDQEVKIGRQTNNKTVPGERNAYFDSKVLSRTHAEIFYSDGKVSKLLEPC